jgi:hypothetical protein
MTTPTVQRTATYGTGQTPQARTTLRILRVALVT